MGGTLWSGLGGTLWYGIVTYALPPDFPNPVGIWMTNKGERLHPMTWDEVIDQMLAMLKCLCFGKCKKGK